MFTVAKESVTGSFAAPFSPQEMHFLKVYAPYFVASHPFVLQSV